MGGFVSIQIVTSAWELVGKRGASTRQTGADYSATWFRDAREIGKETGVGKMQTDQARLDSAA